MVSGLRNSLFITLIPLAACVFVARSTDPSGEADNVPSGIVISNATNASVVSLYLTPDANELIRPRLEQQLRPDSRVVTHDYPIRGWRAAHEERMREEGGRRHDLYLYVVGHVADQGKD